MSDPILSEWQGRVRTAVAAGRPLVIRGGGTKDFYGACAVDSAGDADLLLTTAYAGIVDYDPTELVITARAGTRAGRRRTDDARRRPDARLRAAALRRRRDAGRRDRGGALGAAAALRRRGARFRPRRARDRRPRRRPHVRRPRHEERRGLRRRAADDRCARHAGHRRRGFAQVPAAAEGDGDAGVRLRRRRGDPVDQRVGRQAAAAVGDVLARGATRRARSPAPSRR